jgi:hypothetical protein
LFYFAANQAPRHTPEAHLSRMSSCLPLLRLDANLGTDQTGELASLSWSSSWSRCCPGATVAPPELGTWPHHRWPSTEP